ncbi:MAG: OmpA family protein [Pseudomonadota bacterium]
MKISNLKPLGTTLKLSAIAGALTLAACASLPPNPQIEALQTRMEIISGQNYASQEAFSELEDTRIALSNSRIAYSKDDEDALAHYLVVADKNLDIAESRILLFDTNNRIALASETRETMLRRAREFEVAGAEANARAAEANALAALRDADRKGYELTLAERELAVREAELAAEQRALALKDGELDEANRKLAIMERQAQLLADQLVEVTLVHNERGTVMVLSDIVFDFDSAALKPGSDRALDEIAGFLIDQEQPLVKVEGHTDSVGSHDYNIELSGDRADAVRDALVDRGVSPTTIQVSGFGEEYPVASNDTDEGRQLNRRVEIVLNDRVGRPISLR